MSKAKTAKAPTKDNVGHSRAKARPTPLLPDETRTAKLTAGGYFQRLDKPRQHQRMSETLGREFTANRLAGERIWLDG
jgi:hypothetical protein